MPRPYLTSKMRREPTEVPDTYSALPADLVRALGWLRGHLSEPIELDLLAQIAGVRPRTLEMHFRVFLGRRRSAGSAGCGLHVHDRNY